MTKRALVLGSSRGVGKAIAEELREAGYQTPTLSSKEIDTGDLVSVSNLAKVHPLCDVLVLNTGGPPPKDFFDISLHDWEQYHQQLFVGFNILLQQVKVREGGYIFLISSHLIKEPTEKMILSQAYRTASWSVLKALSKRFAKSQVSCINLGAWAHTHRPAADLNPDLEALNAKLPMHRAGDPGEVGRLVRSLVESNIKYVTGTTIVIDGALSPSLL